MLLGRFLFPAHFPRVHGSYPGYSFSQRFFAEL
jgi:hypothetical protein